jgi:pyruvate carboxylase
VEAEEFTRKWVADSRNRLGEMEPEKLADTLKNWEESKLTDSSLRSE